MYIENINLYIFDYYTVGAHRFEKWMRKPRMNGYKLVGMNSSVTGKTSKIITR